MSSWSVAVPMICTGREWGTSANSAPSVSTSDASNRLARPMTCSVNRRQRRAGSGPSTRMTSPPGVLACHAPTVGHTMLRVRSGVRRTCGRTVAKSVNSSGSISANAFAPQASTR